MIEAINKDFNALLVYEFFKNYALSALGIFIPIIIYSTTDSILLTALFLAFKSTISGISAVPIVKFLNVKGFFAGLGLSYVFLLPSIAAVHLLEFQPLSILLIATLYSIGSNLHREALNLEFTEDSRKEDRSSKAAELMSLPNLGRFLGPIIGGALSAVFGFSSLITVSMAAVILSLVPLRFVEPKFDSDGLELSHILKAADRKLLPVFFSRGIQSVAAVAFYSLFTFIVVGGSFSSGVVRSLDTLGFVMVAYASGTLSEKFSRLSIILFGGIAASIFYLARVAVSTPPEAFIVALGGGIAFKLYHIPLFSSFADKADKGRESEFFVFKRIINAAGTLSTIAVFTAIYLQFNSSQAFNGVFIAASAASLVMIFFSRKAF